MRDLQVVKEKRDYLRDVLRNVNEQRTEFINGRDLKTLSQYEWKVLLEISQGADVIRAQIETLTFVLNEDSEISQAFQKIGRNLTYDDLFNKDIYEV